MQSRAGQLHCGQWITAKRSVIMVGSTDSAIESIMVTITGGILFTQVCFVGNKALKSGGGVLINNFSTFNITGSGAYINNTAGHTGGAFHADDNSQFALNGDNSFIGNCATEGGGMALSWYCTAVLLGNLTVKDNIAEQNGGGFHLVGASLNVTGTGSFVCNAAIGGFGGVISADFYSSIIISGENLLIDNHARNGGGIAMKKFGSTVATGELFLIGNKAQICGGGLYMVESRALLMGNETLISNVAGDCGGGVEAYISTLNISGNGKYVNNAAVNGSGGAISARNANLITLNGDHKLIANYAKVGGGITLKQVRSAFFSGVIAFINNAATWNGGGLNLYQETVLNINGTGIFINNTARSSGGGIYLFFFSRLSSFTAMICINNTAGYSGGAISLYNDSTFNTFGMGSYVTNVADNVGGGIFLASSSLSSSGTLTFNNNVAGSSGGGISATDSNIALDGKITMVKNSAGSFGGAVALDNCELRISNKLLNTSGKVFNVTENQANYSGGAVCALGSHLDMGGRTKLFNNVANSGGGIHAMRSDITLKGLHVFERNMAKYGGGLAFEDYVPTHFVYMLFNASVTFKGNYAQEHGGAIFVHDATDNNCNPGETPPTRACFVNFHTISSALPLVRIPYESHRNITRCIGRTVFEGNVAAAGGSSLYGGVLHNCRVDLSHDYSCDDYIPSCSNRTCYISGIEAVAALSSMSAKQLTENPFNVMSDNFKVCLCESEKPNCQRRNSNYTTHPGEVLLIPIVVVGNAESILSSVIHAHLIESKGVWLDDLQEAQSINASCTTLRYTLHSNGAKAAHLELSVQGPCQYPGLSLHLSVKFCACPPGFSAPFGPCICARRLQKYTNSCDIISRAIRRDGDFWVGFDRHSHGLILHPHCSFDYCKLETVSFTLNSTDLQCAHGRSGILCGACKSGYSLNLGSSQCSSCSNVFLLLFIPFAIAGFLLVVFLFVCKVTVAAGTTSGLIFYANVLAVNKSVFFAASETNVLTVFIAWLNLDLGIETCFIDGMDMYTRTWLQFVFPLYIWLLVGIIALVTRHSTFIARIIGPTNPISVLATLFLLSCTKLLRTIIATLSFTTLDYPDDKSVTVWVYDGNIEYFKGKHIPLFLAGLLGFLLLFLPYTLLLLFGQWIEAGFSHKLLSWINKPIVKYIMDAYHAPYKNRHRYWTGLLLFIRFLLFITSAIVDIDSPRDPTVNLLVLGIVCVVLAILVWNFGSMYKKWYNSFLESSFILNLAILALVSYHVRVEGGNQTAIVHISVSIAFVTFLGIITFHVVELSRDSRVWRTTIAPKLQTLKQIMMHHNDQHDAIEMSPPPTAPSQPVPTTFVELREPLLESQD